MAVFAFVKSPGTHYVLRRMAAGGFKSGAFPKRFGPHNLFNFNGIRGVP
ncbi:hypothetical protein GFPCMMHI_02338 [Ensifer adhaerens]|nr:hypothetical protein [Ensifer adhaerens]